MIEVLFGNLDMEKAYEIASKLPEMDEVEISAILTGLELKGYDSEVLAGFSKAILERVKLDLGKVFDTCGTGGDLSSTINVSTAVAIAMSLFTPIAKHGNRAVSSRSGSADVLEKLGIRIEQPPEIAKRMIKETNFAFLFAPLYHKTFAKVVGVRKKLKIRTIFNILGPLVNPANPERQIIGVSNERIILAVAETLNLLGREGIVFYGNGIDEINPRGETIAYLVENGVERIKLFPKDFGLEESEIIPCNSSEESAMRIRAVFANKGLEEDKKLIAMNFATALYALGYEDLKENVEIFKERVENGDFLRKMEEIICRSTNMSIQ
ncbi:MAG: anthranilate phosphoribosyltransferase [Archaeoglobaceae archaeon]|nr:anthranilate phosphoribosyltransferase [Archaeoglobaceae archaeon]MDW8118878.1 anthranilate phosphoribosyltransferase [Archaeoglobaceae archaeon]